MLLYIQLSGYDLKSMKRAAPTALKKSMGWLVERWPGQCACARLMDWRRVHPDHACHSWTWIAVTMTKNRAEEERILCTGKVAPATDNQLQLTFQYQAKFFALMLDRIVTAASRLDNVDIGFQKHALPEGDEPLVLDAFALAKWINIQNRPAAWARNDIAAQGWAGEEVCKIDFESVSDAVQSRQRGYDPISLDLRQHALRTAGQIGERLLAHTFGQAGVTNAGTEQQRFNHLLRALDHGDSLINFS